MLDREHEIRSAEQVAAELGNMKGALMKLGQMVSYLDEGLPEHLRAALAQLQHDAPPMSGELAASMIESELGRHPDVRLRRVGPGPDRGGVHRSGSPRDDPGGRRRRGQGAVPGRRRRDRGRPGERRSVFGGLGQIFPGLDSGPLVAELRLRLREELDYEREARHQQQFADYYAGSSVHPHPVRAARATRRRGCSRPSWPRAPASPRRRRGRRTSGTSRPRPSSGSCSAASTGCASSTATRTRATTSSGPGAGSRSSTSVSSRRSADPRWWCCGR